MESIKEEFSFKRINSVKKSSHSVDYPMEPICVKFETLFAFQCVSLQFAHSKHVTCKQCFHHE